MRQGMMQNEKAASAFSLDPRTKLLLVVLGSTILIAGGEGGVMKIIRPVILLIPLIFILPLLLENHYQAVLLAEPVTDIVSTSVTVVCFFLFYKKQILNYKDSNSSGQAGAFEV